MGKIKLIATDLDGTLLDDNSKISPVTIELINNLKQYGIITCLATGRSLKTSFDVIPDNLKVDFLIFSSGAGIYDFSQKKIIHSAKLNCRETSFLQEILTTENVDFMLHLPIPDNHKFFFRANENPTEDFIRRKSYYRNYSKPLISKYTGEAAQFLAIFDNPQKYKKIFDKLKDKFGLVRATSPIDGKSIWLEIFPGNTDKGFGIRYICEKYGISLEETLATGNDFNDLAMLETVKYPYVTENSPEELKKKFLNTESNNENGVYSAIINHLPK